MNAPATSPKSARKPVAFPPDFHREFPQAPDAENAKLCEPTGGEGVA